MAELSKIEWTDHTFNPWIGCQHASLGCWGCYAESLVRRYNLGPGAWGPHAERVRTSAANWKLPLKWQRQAEAFMMEHGRRQRVFCASLADVFDNKAPKGARADLFELIRACPDLDWLLLTKRPQNIRKMLPADWEQGYRNVWLGATMEDQKSFDLRWPVLSRIPAAIRFVSYEPAIGPLDIGDARPDWLIAGGESGGKRRHTEIGWIRSIKDQCARNGVAFLMKQWGGYQNNPLVIEGGLSLKDAKARDANGKGGALIDQELFRAWPRVARTDTKRPASRAGLPDCIDKGARAF